MLATCQTLSQTSAQEFSITTEIYLAGKSVPNSSNLTLFSNGVFYDFMFGGKISDHAQEIVIYDARNKRFILLKPEEEVRAEIFVEDVGNFVDSLKTDVELQKRIGFLLDISFDEVSFENDVLAMNSDRLRYKAKGIRPKDQPHFDLILDFMNQYARLNATKVGTFPPFARLKLNEQLKLHNLVPTEVEMTLSLDDGTINTAKSKHKIDWRVSEDDRERIEDAKRIWEESDQISIAKFRQAANQHSK